MQYELKLDRYFVDGVFLSDDGLHATEFLLEADHTVRSKPLFEINNEVERVVPEMLKARGIQNVQILLSLAKFKWYDD